MLTTMEDDIAFSGALSAGYEGTASILKSGGAEEKV
jgi:hypothetical protein